MPLTDNSVRVAAFNWIAEQSSVHGDLLPRKLLEEGFKLEGNRVPLVGPQGIFKPHVLPEIPLSITTAPHGPYHDSFTSSGLLQYKYRGTDALHRDNVGLRNAMNLRIPLIYFHGIVPGKYLPSWPVFIAGDNRTDHTFTVAVDDKALVLMTPGVQPTQTIPDDDAVMGRRAYITKEVRFRLHQQKFRERVIGAYRQQCACCRLRHEQLLDAAHIIPDADPEGEPIVSNGIALCKLHHAAFDSLIIGISPGYTIKVRPDVLREADGPMLKHGLQGMDGKLIAVPRSAVLRPNPVFLDSRFELFKKAG